MIVDLSPTEADEADEIVNTIAQIAGQEPLKHYHFGGTNICEKCGKKVAVALGVMSGDRKPDDAPLGEAGSALLNWANN